MQVVPKPDHVYRRTDNLQLIGPEGFDADPCDLDVIRALECGDLVATAATAAAAPDTADAEAASTAKKR